MAAPAGECDRFISGSERDGNNMHAQVDAHTHTHSLRGLGPLTCRMTPFSSRLCFLAVITK